MPDRSRNTLSLQFQSETDDLKGISAPGKALLTAFIDAVSSKSVSRSLGDLAWAIKHRLSGQID